MNCKEKQRSGALHITQKVDYGIMLLTMLAKQMDSQGTYKVAQQRSIKQIADETHVSFTFLQKIAGLLQKAGLIKSERGKYGGYKLTKEPQETILKEIIEALEGSVAIVPCLKKSESPLCRHTAYCQIRPGLKKINDEIESQILTKPLTHFIS